MEKHSMRDVLLHYGASLPYGTTGWVKMKCCFHPDSHASAVVNYDLNAYKCFACEAKGDVYNLIMNEEGVEFVEAVKIAERISPTGGVAIQPKSSSRRGVSRKPRSNLGRRATSLDRSG